MIGYLSLAFGVAVFAGVVSCIATILLIRRRMPDLIAAEIDDYLTRCTESHVTSIYNARQLLDMRHRKNRYEGELQS